MKKQVYKIEFTKSWHTFKKGDVNDKFSRDISNILVNTLKVAKFSKKIIKK